MGVAIKTVAELDSQAARRYSLTPRLKDGRNRRKGQVPIDAENRFPSENYLDLREHGLMDLTVPKEYGGKGMSSLGFSLVMRELAKGDGSTAPTFDMHATIMIIIDQLGTPEQKARYFTEVVKRGAIFASLGSEPNTSPSAPVFFIETSLTKALGGYRVNGQKHFCSFGNAADYFFAFVMLDGATRVRDGMLVVMNPSTDSLLLHIGRAELGLDSKEAAIYSLEGENETPALPPSSN